MVTLLDMYACLAITVKSEISLEYQEKSSAIELEVRD